MHANPLLEGFDSFEKELAPGIVAQIIDGGVSSVSIVDLAAGSHLPGHTHEQHQFGVIISGTLRLRVGDHTQDLTAGMPYAVAPGVEHEAWVQEDTKVADFFTPARPDFKRDA